MPYGNGTGPAGMGPKTGRARGFCSGSNQPGSVISGRGMGKGAFGQGFFGKGRGIGYSHSPEAQTPCSAEALQNRAEVLRSELSRVEELLKESKKTDL